jgi:hypothetical protein
MPRSTRLGSLRLPGEDHRGSFPYLRADFAQCLRSAASIDTGVARAQSGERPVL